MDSLQDEFTLQIRVVFSISVIVGGRVSNSYHHDLPSLPFIYVTFHGFDPPLFGPPVFARSIGFTMVHLDHLQTKGACTTKSTTQGVSNPSWDS